MGEWKAYAQNPPRWMKSFAFDKKIWNFIQFIQIWKMAKTYNEELKSFEVFFKTIFCAAATIQYHDSMGWMDMGVVFFVDYIFPWRNYWPGKYSQYRNFMPKAWRNESLKKKKFLFLIFHLLIDVICSLHGGHWTHGFWFTDEKENNSIFISTSIDRVNGKSAAISNNLRYFFVFAKFTNFAWWTFGFLLNSISTNTIKWRTQWTNGVSNFESI